MRRLLRNFSHLYVALDETNKTNAKVAALVEYFSSAAPEDAVWALSLLMGRRPRVPVKRNLLKVWAMEVSGVNDWLFDECYSAVGDLSETFSLILPSIRIDFKDQSLSWWMSWIAELAKKDEQEQKSDLLWAWQHLDRWGIFVFHKLIGGAFRVGVSSELVVRALAQVTGLSRPLLAHRLMGKWIPSREYYLSLISLSEGDEIMTSRPYPFCLAHPLDTEIENLGQILDWQAEWKWDGIRAQLIRRNGESFLWSRGEELIHDAFPEILTIANLLPEGTVLDGEILAWDGKNPMPFAQLQRRIGRKAPSKKLLGEVPCSLIAFDLLEWEGVDWRSKKLSERRSQLELVVSKDVPDLILSEVVSSTTWAALSEKREQSRAKFAEGIMLKQRNSDYTGGRKRDAWWKWKINPFSIDAVLVYAQRGSGKRASLYTDYTFAVWSEGKLVPFAKAYSGLTDAEIAQVDNFIRKNVLEKFGPVRTVKPELVFEIAFEGIQLSTRHKSGVAVRFPRILRWRKDKKPEDADTLTRIKELLHANV
jgi:DNA ligase-1